MTASNPEEVLRALREGDAWDFEHTAEPICPHCGEHCSINDSEWWHLYSEEDHSVSCPHCDRDFTVQTHAIHRFSTSEQDDGL